MIREKKRQMTESEIRSRSEKLSALLLETEAYQQMPCWPEPGSIAAIDGVLVVKYSDEYAG